MFYLTTQSPAPPVVGQVWSLNFNPYLWVVLEALPSRAYPDTYTLSLEKAEDVEEWDGLNWVTWKGPFAPLYRCARDRRYVYGSDGCRMVDTQVASACRHTRVNDVGFAAYCLDCDAKMRLIDFAWQVVG
jgi:hypothetical protein